MKQRGIILLELVLAGALLGLLFGAVGIALSQDTQTTRVLIAPVSPEMRAQAVLERIATELRMAGEWGEDLDQDGQLDDGEDKNGNGILDADWTLADGAKDQSSMSFNRRIDEYDPGGTLLTTGVFSRRVTYRLDGDRLVREWMLSSGAGTEERSATIAYDIGGLRFSRTGKIVSIELDALLPERVYKTDRRTVRTQVWLRN